MRIKTNLKADTHCDDNPYHRLYLSLFEAAYGVKLSRNTTPASPKNSPSSVIASEPDNIDEATSHDTENA